MRIAVISPINTPDGISRYSRSLYSALPSDIEISYLANQDIGGLAEQDTENVFRLWIGRNQNFIKVVDWIAKNNPDLIHIQLHPEYFPPECLSELLAALDDHKVIVTMHSFGGWYADYAELLNQPFVQKVIIHRQDSQATELIDSSKLVILPLGFNSYPKLDQNELKKSLGIDKHSPIIVTHGLITPSKGLLETAAAIRELREDYPNILWVSANAVNPNNPSSQVTLKDLTRFIETYSLDNNVELITDFLTDTQASSIIQAADIGLCAYKEVGEGASDAVRKFISCGIPTIVTDIPVMAEFQEEVYKIKDISPESIASGITDLWKAPGLRERISSSAINKATSLSWGKIALKLFNLYNS